MADRRVGAAELCSAFALGGAAALLGARCSCGPPADAAVKAAAARRSGAVLSLGISVLDYSVYLDAFPAPDSKQVAQRQVAGGGGNAANTAVAVSRLGVPAVLLSKVGDDPAGATLLGQLRDEGVECAVQVSGGAEGGSTVTCFVLVAGDTRTIVSMPMSQRVADLTPMWVKEALTGGPAPCLLERTKLLQLDGRHPVAGAHAAALCRARGIGVLVEAELRSAAAKAQGKPEPTLAALLVQADYLVTSAEMPTACTGIAELVPALREMVRRHAPHARWAVVTLGESGCVAIERSESEQSEGWRELRVPACPLEPGEVVDTTGAGDAFIGGLAAATVRGLGLEEALRVAAWVAAENCRGEGARGGMPSADRMPVELRGAWG